MRPVMHGDVVAAARVLLTHTRDRRGAAISRLLQEARWADVYRRTVGQVHPMWGDGSLMTAALMRCPPSEPSLADTDYCACMGIVFDALVDMRR